MGWTHYWYREIEMPDDKFKTAVNDFKKILSALDIRLGNAEGKKEPVLTDEEIIFNDTNRGCEPFVFRRVQSPRLGKDKVFQYCKTEHMPYDLAVQCCLIVLTHNFDNSIKVSSDGKKENWKKACELCEEKLHYGLNFTLSSD